MSVKSRLKLGPFAPFTRNPPPKGRNSQESLHIKCLNTAETLSRPAHQLRNRDLSVHHRASQRVITVQGLVIALLASVIVLLPVIIALFPPVIAVPGWPSHFSAPSSCYLRLSSAMILLRSAMIKVRITIPTQGPRYDRAEQDPSGTAQPASRQTPKTGSCPK